MAGFLGMPLSGYSNTIGQRPAAPPPPRPQPPAPAPVHPQLAPHDESYVRRAGGDPSQFTTIGGSIVANKFLGPAPEPRMPVHQEMAGPAAAPAPAVHPAMAAAAPHPAAPAMDPYEAHLRQQVAFHAQGPRTPVYGPGGEVYATGNEHAQALNALMAYQQHQSGMAHSQAQTDLMRSQAAQREDFMGVLSDPGKRATYLLGHGVPMEDVASLDARYPTGGQPSMGGGPVNGQNFGAMIQSPQGSFIKDFYNPDKPEVGSAMSPLEIFRGLRSRNIPGLNDPHSLQSQLVGQLYRQRFPGGVPMAEDPNKFGTGRTLWEGLKVGLGGAFGYTPQALQQDYQDSQELQAFLNQVLNGGLQPQY